MAFKLHPSKNPRLGASFPQSPALFKVNPRVNRQIIRSDHCVGCTMLAVTLVKQIKENTARLLQTHKPLWQLSLVQDDGRIGGRIGWSGPLSRTQSRAQLSDNQKYLHSADNSPI